MKIDMFLKKLDKTLSKKLVFYPLFFALVCIFVIKILKGI